MQAVYSRLSVATFLQDARFSAWNISLKAAQERPILGWGAENFSIAFDKHYDPTLPILKAESGSWWDRAHSLFFDTIIQFGLAGLVAYAFFFGAWFWQLTKIKNNNSGLHTSFIFEAHALQATLIAYLTADLFSFDSFSTYIMVFFLAGYSMHLIAISAASMPQAARRGAPLWQKGLLVLLLVSTGWFLWQENINILFINEKINTALTLATQRQCDQATAMMDTVMSEHSFLDVYARTEYINMMRNCTIFYPEKSALYADKGVTIMKEAVVIRPLSSRLWIFLGSFTTVQASQQQDANKKNELLNEAKIYLAKADALSPNRQETFIEQAKTDMISGDYQHMNISATTCTTLYPTVNDCYWLKGISQIYLGNLDQAQQDMAAAQKLAFDTTDIFALHQLISAYTYTKRYQELAATYEKIISLRPQTAQYHSSLALVYKILGEYKKARQEALKFLQLTPEAKDEVQEFLQGLPQ
jgi:Flp pilus assembly protein TadD